MNYRFRGFNKLHLTIQKKISNITQKHRWLRGTLLFIRRFFEDDIVGIASETAFYLLLSLFPLIIIISSTLSRYSARVETDLLALLLPGSVAQFLSEILIDNPIFSDLPLIPVTITLWSASQGIWALMKGICRAYTGKNPEKAFFKRFIAPLFVIVFIAVIAFGITVWIVGQSLLSKVDGILSAIIMIIKYAIVFLGLLVFVLAIYVYTPGYDIKIRQMLPGAMAASAAWIVANIAFEFYLRNFSNYSVLYGSFGTFLGLVIWLFITSLIILIGAEINSALICCENDS